MKKERFAPLLDTQVDALMAAITEAGCYPVPVFDRGCINEMAIYRHGAWFGSIVRNSGGGLLTLDEDGTKLATASRPASAVRALLDGRKGPVRNCRKRPATPRATVAMSSPGSVSAPAGRVVAPQPSTGSYAEISAA